METNQIVFRRWDDVIFENRNKLYGAYLLRRTYANHLLSGVGITVFVVGLILFIHAGSKESAVIENTPAKPLDGAVIRVLPPPPIEPRPVVPTINPPSARTRGPVLVTQQEVTQEDPYEPVVEFASDDGVGTGEVVPLEGNGTVEMPAPEPVNEPRIVDFAEMMPQYEGGMEAMMKFIQKKIRYPRVPRELGIEGTVFVSFVVAGDGSVTDVRIIRSVHPDYDKEAMRVISMLPRWRGGSHNGRPVSVRMVMPIKFNLQK